ncbi:hypothetical protein RFI_11068 [Reticulomyxa filosa]|uniref:Uncharacterized protein n=1 Tax=Reticulomyxa filosa TaxID=46433 RepID=X6NL02_RETFI|nr:hypothetical protein RFI_11068 [Reticulomyxa filosa]|eukprot:ETO26067.1 hypothetical protein RFI_11068 [Reticulomyxa filosa]
MDILTEDTNGEIEERSVTEFRMEEREEEDENAEKEEEKEEEEEEEEKTESGTVIATSTEPRTEVPPTTIVPLTIKDMPQCVQFTFFNDVENLQKQFCQATFRQQTKSNEFKTLKERARYWSNVITANLEVIHGVLQEDFIKMCYVFYGRWLLIGHAIYQLQSLWEKCKEEIKREYGVFRIGDWLPLMLRGQVNPCFQVHCGYSQLKKYLKIFIHRDVIIPMCKLTQEFTRNLDHMVTKLKEFQQKVRLNVSKQQLRLQDATGNANYRDDIHLG